MTPEPSTAADASTSPTENDVNVITASSGDAPAVPTSSPPTQSLNKSKSYKSKDQKPKGLMSSIRRSSSVKKLTEKYGSLKSKAVSKGIIQKSKKKVRKSNVSETSVDSPVSVKDIDAGNKSQAFTPVNEEASSKYEEETCFNVEFDSLPAGMEAPMDGLSTAGASMKEDATTIVLLLLDGRRFELLQLEMNPKTAVVQDILNQIPIESTDKALRNQSYVGVCDRNGIELDAKKLVGDYYPLDPDVYYVAMALPEVMSREEVVKFSKPIFSDTNISTMFKGKKTEGTSTQQSVSMSEEETVTAPVSKEEEIVASPEEIAASPEENVTEKPSSGSEETTVTVKQTSTEQPVSEKGETIASTQKPISKPKASLKATASIKKEMKKIFGNPSSKKKQEQKLDVKEEKKVEVVEKKLEKPDMEKDNKEEKDADISEQQAKAVDSRIIINKPPGATLRFSIFAVLFSMIPILAMLQHEKVYSPLLPNQELKVGEWRSSCGLFRFIPDPYKHCDSILLKMEEGGSLTLMDEGTNTIFWEMRSFASCDEGCSAVMTDAGIVEIGGEPAALVSSSKVGIPEFSAPWPFENDKVAPSWPFSADINMKPKRKRKKNRGTK